MKMFYYLLLLVANLSLLIIDFLYPKVLYKSVLLFSKNVALRKNVTYHSQKRILSACSIILSFHETCEINKGLNQHKNNKHSVKHAVIL